MKVGSLFSGILGGDLGLEQAGHETVWCAEIEPFCNRVIAYRRPGLLNLGDVREIDGRRLEPVDVVCFGSPCQDLSVAGRRAGLAGARSGLFFEAARVIGECRPALALWENVPGAFSSNAGRDFAMVLSVFRELGARDIAWRVIDSQYAGVPQRRRRIFLVADFTERTRAGEILFESDRCEGHPAPGRAAGEGIAPTLRAGSNRTGGHRPPGTDVDTVETLQVVAATLRGRAHGPGSNAPGRGGEDDSNLVLAGTLTPHSHPGFNGQDDANLVVIQDARTNSKAQNGLGVAESETMYTLDGTSQHAVGYPSGVRRLTPLEAEALQGFPPDWTDIPGASDSARYRALGNAMTVPVLRWIGERL